MKNLKNSISAALLAVSFPLLSFAQQPAPPKAPKAGPFQGSLYIQAIAQENPGKRETKGMRRIPHNMQVGVRLSFAPGKIAIDSMTEKGRHNSRGNKAIIDYNANTVTTLRTTYDGVLSGELINLKDKHEKAVTEQDTTSRKYKEMHDKSFQMEYTVTGETQTIEDMPCRKVVAENAMMKMDIWVTDGLGLKLDDFAKFYNATHDNKDFAELYAMAGKIPDVLKNGFPMSMVLRIKEKPYSAAKTGKPQPVMPSSKIEVAVIFHVVKIDKKADPSIFDVSAYHIVPKKYYSHTEESDDIGVVDETDTTTTTVPADTTAPMPAVPAGR